MSDQNGHDSGAERPTTALHRKVTALEADLDMIRAELRRLDSLEESRDTHAEALRQQDLKLDRLTDEVGEVRAEVGGLAGGQRELVEQVGAMRVRQDQQAAQLAAKVGRGTVGVSAVVVIVQAVAEALRAAGVLAR